MAGLLLIDIGNTRVKWRHAAARKWNADNARGAAFRTQITELVHEWSVLDFDHVQVANVAGAQALDRVASSIRAARAEAAGGTTRHDRGLCPNPLPASVGTTARAIEIAVLVSSPAQCGVVNCYPQPERLGADRWAALIGARALELAARADGAAPENSMIVSLGTATTIDVLAADGQFRGGVILPGFAAMHDALARNTAALPHAGDRLTPLGREALADNTADATANGILHAQLGAIERIWRQVSSPSQCLLCGGNAARIAPLLPFARLEEDLVLRGLYKVARASQAETSSSDGIIGAPGTQNAHLANG